MIAPSAADVAGLSISRFASTGAFAIGAIFAVCWAAAALGVFGSHAFIGSFTLAPTASFDALVFGGICAVIAGAVAGLLIAIGYNLSGRCVAR